MLSWCLDRRDTDQAAEYGSSIKEKSLFQNGEILAQVTML